jgi:hypothetical protein
MKETITKKYLVIFVILLFIGVAIAPSINSSLVKTSNDNDLIEVTSQACGIEGFGNTTVKLNKQQYQDLQNYLVDFRARLNQTTTREETVPLFKDAVVELNKYGLLPKDISIEEAQHLVLGCSQNTQMKNLCNKIKHSFKMDNYTNYFCLTAGHTTNTVSRGPILSALDIVSILLWQLGIFLRYYTPYIKLSFVLSLIVMIPMILFDIVGVGTYLSHLNPLCLLSTFGLGMSYDFYPMYFQNPASGYLFTLGLNGIKHWSGYMYGNIFPYELDFMGSLITSWVGVVGFTGIKISLPFFNSFYIGYALEAGVSMSF